MPKPLVEFANKPIIQHQIEALAEAGVTDIVLAVNYRPEAMAAVLQKYEDLYNVKITISVETEPLGTGKSDVMLTAAHYSLSFPCAL
ncbi:mannose-1-phosphate guanyltransferase [Podila epigama]|nr:mannose-1-phosphate guanyltransferase [Podila epigama]